MIFSWVWAAKVGTELQRGKQQISLKCYLNYASKVSFLCQNLPWNRTTGRFNFVPITMFFLWTQEALIQNGTGDSIDVLNKGVFYGGAGIRGWKFARFGFDRVAEYRSLRFSTIDHLQVGVWVDPAKDSAPRSQFPHPSTRSALHWQFQIRIVSWLRCHIFE